jgi:hypothetical protein
MTHTIAIEMRNVQRVGMATALRVKIDKGVEFPGVCARLRGSRFSVAQRQTTPRATRARRRPAARIARRSAAQYRRHESARRRDTIAALGSAAILRPMRVRRFKRLTHTGDIFLLNAVKYII